MIANPIPWPDGARCAVAMTWDMDADSAFNWYNQETADNLVATQQWARYDPLIAIPRLVEQFARLELRQTFFVPGWVIEKYPAQIDLLLKNGHEIGLHGYLHERSNEIDKDDEHYWLGPRARRLSQACRRPAARLAGAELCVLEILAALPDRRGLRIRFLADGRRHPLRAARRQRLAARISGRLDARRLPALRP